MAVVSSLNRDAKALQGSVRTNLDYSSGIRKGTVESLPVGVTGFRDVKGPCIISTREGGIAYSRGGRVEIGTFLLSKKYPYKYADLYAKRKVLMDGLSNDFVKFETKTICDKLSHQDNLFYADREKVTAMQDFFYNLGRNVIVLPNEEVVDINSKSFHLIIRTDLCIEVFDEPMRMVTNFAAWEEVGFLYQLEKNYDSYIRSYPAVR